VGWVLFASANNSTILAELSTMDVKGREDSHEKHFLNGLPKKNKKCK
jgi:hypothetical protein